MSFYMLIAHFLLYRIILLFMGIQQFVYIHCWKSFLFLSCLSITRKAAKILVVGFCVDFIVHLLLIPTNMINKLCSTFMFSALRHMDSFQCGWNIFHTMNENSFCFSSLSELLVFLDFSPLKKRVVSYCNFKFPGDMWCWAFFHIYFYTLW